MSLYDLLGGLLLLVGVGFGSKLFGDWWVQRPTKEERELEKAVRKSEASSLAEVRSLLVESTTDLLNRRSGSGLQTRLERSGSQLRSGEWVLMVLAAAAFLGIVGLAAKGPIIGALLAIVTCAGAWHYLGVKIKRRRAKFAEQLPEFLMNLSSALRSGASLPQAIASIAPDMEAPAGEELRRVVIENRIGRDLVLSFQDLSDRMDCMDFDWVVRAIEINRSTGGDLPSVLRRLDATIRARNAVAGTVQSLTAEGRLSGLILTALPIFMFVFLYWRNKEFLAPMLYTGSGRLMMGGGILLLTVGYIWLNRLAKFKY